MTSPVVFLDTETTGLSPDAQIWEFAGIRRDDDGQRELHMFIDHDPALCRGLPESFRADHATRFPAACSDRVTTRENAAYAIHSFTRDAHIVGAVPNFDTERIARMLDQTAPHRRPEWHYHLIDVEAMAVGCLASHGHKIELPWRSDDLSRLVGIEPPGDGVRHTAMGDARWAMHLYDAIINGAF